MSDFTKMAIAFAVLWAADGWQTASRLHDDFKACHEQALQVLVIEKIPPIQLHLPPDLNQHDQVDELIQRCMLAHGYDYAPTGWEKCPSEKLPACYDKPTWIGSMYREVRSSIAR